MSSQFQLPLIAVAGILLLFAIFFSIRPVGRVLLITHVKFIKWIFRRTGECDIDGLGKFYAKLFFFFAVCAGFLIVLFATDLLSREQSYVVLIAAMVMLSTSFIPTYINILKDERYFKKE